MGGNVYVPQPREQAQAVRGDVYGILFSFFDEACNALSVMTYLESWIHET